MSSSSKTANTTNNITNTADERIIAEGGSNVLRATNGGVINNLDGGAIDLAGQVAQEALDTAQSFGLNSLDLARDSLTKTGAAFDQFAARDRSDSALFFETVVKYAIPATAIYFIAKVYLK